MTYILKSNPDDTSELLERLQGQLGEAFDSSKTTEEPGVIHVTLHPMASRKYGPQIVQSSGFEIVSLIK